MEVRAGLLPTKPSSEQILDQVEHHLIESTLEEVSLPQVARELGVTSRHIFKHFRSKLEIADALASRQISRLMVDFNQRLVTETPKEKLAAFLQGPALHWIRVIETRPGMASVLVTAVGRQRRAVINLREFILEKLQTILEEGQKSGDFRPFDPPACSQAIFDIMAVVADPRVVQLVTLNEVSARKDRVASFIISSVLRSE